MSPPAARRPIRAKSSRSWPWRRVGMASRNSPYRRSVCPGNRRAVECRPIASVAALVLFGVVVLVAPGQGRRQAEVNAPKAVPIPDREPRPQPDSASEGSGNQPSSRPVAAPTAPDSEGWVSLFNGSDLAGWKTHPTQPAALETPRRISDRSRFGKKLSLLGKGRLPGFPPAPGGADRRGREQRRLHPGPVRTCHARGEQDVAGRLRGHHLHAAAPYGGPAQGDQGWRRGPSGSTAV